MTPHELLVKGRELISDEKRWTQGVMATNERGQQTDPVDPDAFCFCSVGALVHLSDKDLELRIPATDALREAMAEYIIGFNDSHTHSEVLAAWDRAIAATAEGEAK